MVEAAGELPMEECLMRRVGRLLVRPSVTAIKYLQYWTYVPHFRTRAGLAGHKRGEETSVEKEWCEKLG